MLFLCFIIYDMLYTYKNMKHYKIFHNTNENVAKTICRVCIHQQNIYKYKWIYAYKYASMHKFSLEG